MPKLCNELHSGNRMSLISSFIFDFYPVNNYCFCPFVNRVQYAVAADADAITFFFSKLFRAARSWIGCKGKDCHVNSASVFNRNSVSFFSGLLLYYDCIIQSLSHFFRNLSYGIKAFASLSALRRSLVSSRSSINSRIFS